MLDLEAEIVARLEERLAGVAHVLTAASLTGLLEGRSVAPAVYVVYVSGSVANPEDWDRLLIEQRWWVVAVTRYADASGAGARSSASDLSRAVFAALAGWLPEGATAPLLLAGLPAAQYLAGVQLLPLEFATQIALSMEQDP